MKYKQDYFGFVYLWYDRKNKRYYVGSSRRSLTCSYKSSNRHLNFAIAKRPDDFKRRILFLLPINQTNVDLKKEEQRWLDMIKENEFGNKYYNLSPYATGGRPSGFKNTAASNLKRSLALRGRPKPDGFGIGRTHTEESKRKISEFHKGKPVPTRRRNIKRTTPAWNKGIPMDDKAKENLRQKNLGKKHSMETRAAIGNSLRGQKRGPYKKEAA